MTEYPSLSTTKPAVAARELIACGDALVEGGKHAESQLTRERWLTNQEQCERALRIHLGVGEQAQLLELVRCQHVRLIDDEHHAAAALMFFGSQ